MTKVNHLLQRAREMQQNMATLQKELGKRSLDIDSGEGMVRIKINGKQEIVDFKLKEECVDPQKITALEELIKTAFNQAIKKSQQMVTESMSKITSGFGEN